MKLRTGDTVVVISGKDKGKTGTILKIFPVDGKIVVAGLNLRTRHVKKTSQGPGRILRYEASLHASKVMIIDPKTMKRSRIGFKIDEKGNMIRISKVSGEEVAKVRAEKKPKATRVTEVIEEKNTETPKKAAKQPFWKKVGFGAEALADAEVTEGSRMKQDHSIPAQEQHVRAGARGS